MNLDELLQYSIDEYNEDKKEKFTHLFNVSAAISKFPSLMDDITTAFINDDQEILDEYNKIKKDDNKFRERVVRAIMYAEKTDRETLKQIIVNYVTRPDFNAIVLENSKRTNNPKEYALACALLDDYYTYLETDEWNGLSTRI